MQPPMRLAVRVRERLWRACNLLEQGQGVIVDNSVIWVQCTSSTCHSPETGTFLGPPGSPSKPEAKPTSGKQELSSSTLFSQSRKLPFFPLAALSDNHFSDLFYQCRVRDMQRNRAPRNRFHEEFFCGGSAEVYHQILVAAGDVHPSASVCLYKATCNDVPLPQVRTTGDKSVTFTKLQAREIGDKTVTSELHHSSEGLEVTSKQILEQNYSQERKSWAKTPTNMNLWRSHSPISRRSLSNEGFTHLLPAEHKQHRRRSAATQLQRLKARALPLQ